MPEHNSTSTQVIDYDAIVAAQGLTQPWDPPYWQGRAFQLVVRDHLIRNKRAIMSVHKGLGKTSTLLSIFEDPRVHQDTPGFTVLGFTNEKGMSAYLRDIKMFPEWEGKIQLVFGSKAERERQWKNPTARYFISTYSGFLSDIGMRGSRFEYGRESIIPKWVRNGSVDGAFFDEFHRVMRSRNSKFFTVASSLFKHTKYLYCLSGSAVSKGPQDLWPALHVCDPKLWSSYWKYVYTWCHVEEGQYRKVGDPRADRVTQWRTAVRPYVSHVTAEMVGNAMQPLNRDLMPITLPKWQKKLHDNMLAQSFMELPNDEYAWAENALTKIHKLRTALICPKVLSPELGIGQGIEDIWEDAYESELTRYNIFTPFRAPIPHLQAWLESKGARVWVLQGGIGLVEQDRRLDAWNRYVANQATPEAPGIILGTIKYGESWECPASSYGYMLGEEWDPEDNKQAESRLLRLISPAPVFIRYTHFLGTYCEQIQEQLVMKSANVRLMFKTWGQLKKLVHQNIPY